MQTPIRTWKEDTVQGALGNDECAEERRHSRGLSPRAREGWQHLLLEEATRVLPRAPDGSTALGPQTSACRTERMSVLLVELLQQRQDSVILQLHPSLCPHLGPMAPVHSDTTFNSAGLF